MGEICGNDAGVERNAGEINLAVQLAVLGDCRNDGGVSGSCHEIDLYCDYQTRRGLVDRLD